MKTFKKRDINFLEIKNSSSKKQKQGVPKPSCKIEKHENTNSIVFIRNYDNSGDSKQQTTFHFKNQHTQARNKHNCNLKQHLSCYYLQNRQYHPKRKNPSTLINTEKL